MMMWGRGQQVLHATEIPPTEGPCAMDNVAQIQDGRPIFPPNPQMWNGAGCGQLFSSVPSAVNSGRDKDTANMQRRNQRQRQNKLVASLDSVLPASAKLRAVINGAGGRSLGRQGRGLHDVLGDTVDYVRQWRSRMLVAPPLNQEHVEDSLDLAAAEPQFTMAAEPAVQLDEDLLRKGMLSSHSFAVIELAMPGFVMHELNPAALQLFGHMPHIKFKGQSLLNCLVHPDDMHVLHKLFKDAQRKYRERKKTTAHSQPGLHSSHDPDPLRNQHACGVGKIGVGRGRLRMLRVQRAPTA